MIVRKKITPNQFMAAIFFFSFFLLKTRKATYPKIINYQTIQDNFIYERKERQKNTLNSNVQRRYKELKSAIEAPMN